MKKLLLSVMLVSTFLTACQKAPTELNEKPSAIKINVVKPQSQNFAKTLTLSGNWVAKDTVAINSALQGQQIMVVLVEVGQRVKKGQILATLENSNVRSNVEQNQANLAKA